MVALGVGISIASTHSGERAVYMTDYMSAEFELRIEVRKMDSW
jgi:hypothetical protein